jgi:hypothetical protein
MLVVPVFFPGQLIGLFRCVVVIDLPDVALTMAEKLDGVVVARAHVLPDPGQAAIGLVIGVGVAHPVFIGPALQIPEDVVKGFIARI